jgi:hypothetical protein
MSGSTMPFPKNQLPLPCQQIDTRLSQPGAIQSTAVHTDTCMSQPGAIQSTAVHTDTCMSQPGAIQFTADTY